jgi:CRP/FNR family transcriptional regulator, anaerobic regulatory protein
MSIQTELGTIADLGTGARVIPAGSDLYRQGDTCASYFIVLNGWLALSVVFDDGSCQILDFALPGAVLGFQQAPNAPMYHSARCLSVVRAYAFPRRKLDMIIETNPRLAILLCRQITANEARAHDHLANIGIRDARQRIARLLLELYVRVRQRLPVERGEIFQLPLSQEQIGHALGLTYVHVCRTLRVLREQKIVRLSKPRLEIIDPEALIATAGIENGMPGAKQRVGRQARERPARFTLEQKAASSLPAGWIPMQNERAVPPHPASASHPTATTGFHRFTQVAFQDFTSLAA